MKRYFFGLLLLSMAGNAQQLAPLTVQKIMRDPKWMGTSPSNYRWSKDSKTIYFNWNPEAKEKDQLFKVTTANYKPVLTDDKAAEQDYGINYTYNKDESLGLLERNGDIFLYHAKTKKEQQLTNTLDRESNPNFLSQDRVVYQKAENVFLLDPKTAAIKQLTNFVKGKRPGAEVSRVSPTTLAQDTWLKAQQIELLDIIKKRAKDGNGNRSLGRRLGNQTNTTARKISPIYLEDKALSGIVVSPTGRYVSYRLTALVTTNKNTIIPNYITASGYTEDIPGRTKVGEVMNKSESFIYDTERDTVYTLKTNQIPGIKDLPDYLKDYPAKLEEAKKKNADRLVDFNNVVWNEDGSFAGVMAFSQDNKDWWILKIDPTNGNLTPINRLRDEAWIGGPGRAGINFIDNKRFYFTSEATGYSHLYLYDVVTHEKKQLTSGNWEVQRVQLSKDKKTFYISGNKEHPGITHFYKIPVDGGNLTQITTMKGGNEVTLSPDEKWIAINHSYMNQPWELYVQENKPGAKPKKITKSTTAEFESYQWRQPDLVSFKNRYGDAVYARVYPATNPHPNKPAVVFVHGAGYLQNVHFWWSQYFREYMFNNLLADHGYTVIDIDYTASSGYGRNHRTGIYRHMGGKDLTDQVDGVKLLVEKYGVNPAHIGMYGGSYGGFMTLMALFTEPKVFASGAALRSVTDWAHYNHGYTSNILNEPFTDPIAYKKSSPINFADGLQGNLLMLHGMVDVNVHYQDIVRLSQKLIELGKDNWSLASYPVEDHGFVEPSSWTDEYKRIFNHFESTLKK